MPSNKDWGPFVWTFLHGLAEKLGRQSNELLAADEAREMMLVLRTLEHVMPCEKCRTHYHEYLKKNPIDEISSRRSDTLRQTVRMWLWKLHEAINERNGATTFPLESLTSTYQCADISAAWNTFLPLFIKAVANGQITSEALKSFRRHVSFLRSLVGV